MENRCRNIEFKLRLSPKEYEIFEAKWRESGLRDRSTFLRDLIIHGYVYYIDYSYLYDYNMALDKIGTNLNQIAKKANETGMTDNYDLVKARELMEDIWRTHESMLSKQPLANL